MFHEVSEGVFALQGEAFTFRVIQSAAESGDEDIVSLLEYGGITLIDGRGLTNSAPAYAYFDGV